MNPKAILASKMHEGFEEFAGLINKYVPKKRQERIFHLFWSYVNLSDYLRRKSDEELMHDYIMDTQFYPNCPICVTDEQIEDGTAGEAINNRLPCTLSDCPEYGECWGPTGKEPTCEERGLYP